MKSKKQLYKELAKRICLDFSASESLPGERVLATKYCCTRATVRATLLYLRKQDILTTHSRRGHILNPQKVRETKIISPKMRSTNVMLILSKNRIQDPSYNDMVAGIIDSASETSVNLIVREIDTSRGQDILGHLNSLHPDFEADAYIVAGCFSPRLQIFLEQSMRPCVVFGETPEMRKYEAKRYVQVGLPQYEKYQVALEKLLCLGHRKILIVSNQGCVIKKAAQDYLLAESIDDCKLTEIQPERPTNPLVPYVGFAEQVCDMISDHTAMIIAFAGATALDIWRTLQERNIKVPERLSLIIESYRIDSFVRVFDIATMHSSSWQEGKACFEEILQQLDDQEIRFGQKRSEYMYIEGKTVGPPFELTK